MGRRRKPQPYAPLDEAVHDQDEAAPSDLASAIDLDLAISKQVGNASINIQIQVDPTWSLEEGRHVGQLLRAILAELD